MENTVLFLSLMVVGTAFLGLYDVFTRKFLREGMHEGMLLGATFTLTGSLSLPIMLLVGIPTVQSGFWIAALATVLLNIISQLLWYKAFQREEASLIAPLRLLTPPIVLVTGFFVLGEIPSVRGAVGVLTTIGGLWFLAHTEAMEEKKSWHHVFKKSGVLLGIVGAFLFALSFPFDKKAVVLSSTLLAMPLVSLGIGIPHLLWAISQKESTATLWHIGRKPIQFLGYIVIHVLGSLLTFHALNFSQASYAASVKRLWSLWAVLFSGRLLRERAIRKKLVAVAIMLLGIVLTVI